MFSIGDRVVHPMHGAGIIHGIVEEKVGGDRRSYYVFRLVVGGLVLKIPVAGSSSIGLRAILDRESVEQVLEALPALSAEMSSNWSRRYRKNLERLKTGDLYEVARVIKGLMGRDREKGLSTGERKMLHNAKQILVSEIMLIEGTGYQETEKRVTAAAQSRGAG